jgi:hypothetical protein
MYEYDFDVETCTEIVEIVQRTFTKCHQHISSSIQQHTMSNDELYHNVLADVVFTELLSPHTVSLR